MDYMHLFKLCGYDEEEITRESPRIDKAFQRMDIGEEDVRRAEGRIMEHYDVQLQGVRKLLGVHMREMINVVLAREENRMVVYSEWPGVGTALMMAGIHSVKDVYFGTPASQTINMVMGSIFDKLSPILEAGEQNGLPAGEAHCALWQTHLGAIVKGVIPAPDLLVSPGYLCDIPAETDQMLYEVHGIPVVYFDGCLDAQWGEWPNIRPGQVKYAAGKLEKTRRKIEEVIGCSISDDAVRASFWDIMKIYLNLQPMVELMGRADPQPTSQVNIDLAWWLVNNPMRHRDDGVQALNMLTLEVKQLIDEGKGILPKGAPRIYLAQRVAVDPSVLRMIEDVGLALPSCCVDWLLPVEMEIKATDPYEVIMEGLFRKGLCSGSGGIAYDVECCKKWEVDGAIIPYPYSCRLYAITPLMIKAAIKKELGIPAMVLEWDAYDTRQYSAGQLRTRVETFAELLRATKGMKAE